MRGTRKKPRRLRLLPRFRRDASGVTSIEFGLVGLPFVAMLFATLETSLVFLADQVLETATGDAARLVRTGQAQAQGMSADSFRTAICDKSGAILKCENIVVDVRTYPDFASVNLTPPTNPDGSLNGQDQYDPGNGEDIVVVRAYYEWPIFVRLFYSNLSNMPNGKRLLVATSAFRNEPFPW